MYKTLETIRRQTAVLVAVVLVTAALAAAPAAALPGGTPDQNVTPERSGWFSETWQLSTLLGFFEETFHTVWDGIRETVDPNGEAADSTQSEEVSTTDDRDRRHSKRLFVL